MFGVKLDFSSVTLTGSSDSDSKNYDFILLKEEFSYFFHYLGFWYQITGKTHHKFWSLFVMQKLIDLLNW